MARVYPRPVVRPATGAPPDISGNGVGRDAGPSPAGLSEMVSLFRGADSLSRSQLAGITGLARNTVSQRLDLLLAAGLLTTADGSVSTGGRPAERFRFAAERGVLLAADVGATAFRAAVCDLGGEVIDEVDVTMDVGRGPRAILKAVDARFGALLAKTGRTAGDVFGIGLDVPGPVDFSSGRVVSPPIMTGWDGFDIPGWFAPTYDAPVLVDKDVNAMAVGEHHERHAEVDDLMFVKIGTGVGSGLITGGRVHRGADGAAGDIGHIQLVDPLTDHSDKDQPECRCGNVGCVEAYAGGWALVRDLAVTHPNVTTVDDVVTAIRSGDIVAQRLLRRAGRILGHALADAVNLVNPRVIAVGGQLAHADEQLLAGIREVVYRRSLPLATRKLLIVRSQLDRRAGLVGLACLLAEEIFAPASLARLIADPARSG